MPATPVRISLAAPGGAISEQQLKVCERISGDSEARLAKLEQKSITLLSAIAVVAPLTASAAIFIRKESLPPLVDSLTIVMDLLAALFLLLAFVAVLRALAVRGQQELFLNTVIDPEADAFRTYDADFYGRGLLFVAAHRQAICDHVADFVRATQVFLALGVTWVVLAAAPVLFFVEDDTQRIEGAITLDSATNSALRGMVERALVEPSARLGRLESQLDSLIRAQNDRRTQEELKRLRREIAELKRRLSSR